MTGLVVLCATLAAGLLAGVVMKARGGRVRDATRKRKGMDDTSVMAAGDLGHDLGASATLVQFSTAFCQPCRATRRILSEVSGMVDGVRHVEIDAESRLDLVRRFDVMRTPTVLVLDRDGRVVKKASGQPRKADVIAALGFMTSHETDGT
ncbi:thioredoxin family protein [Sphaerisporangium sp. NPDC051017]|uniref:thioredoxin family protein n=1 Tax=Sphaerisporangium sp. NPDC051017 TaxID=3154636 RepID=UPI0034347921